VFTCKLLNRSVDSVPSDPSSPRRLSCCDSRHCRPSSRTAPHRQARRSICLLLILVGVVTADEAPHQRPDVLLGNGLLQVTSPATAQAENLNLDGTLLQRVSVSSASLRPWHVSCIVPTKADMKAGDTVVVRLHLRAISTPDSRPGRVTVFLQRHATPWTKSLHRVLTCGKEWSEVVLPCVVREDYPAGGAAVVLALAHQSQVIDLADLRLEPLGAGVASALVPGATPLTYAGREVGAAWRESAEARIRRIRTSPLTVRVRAHDGLPVANAAVTIRQKRHAFIFGTAIEGRLFSQPGPAGNEYRRQLMACFNRATPSNQLKWPQWQADPGPAINVVRRLNELGLPVQGHCLVWPDLPDPGTTWLVTPPELSALVTHPAELRLRVAERVVGTVSTLRGQVGSWEVVNQPIHHHDLMDVLGEDTLVEWFRLARAADPNARLLLVDGPPLHAGSNPHLDALIELLRRIQAHKAPLDAVGLQLHIGSHEAPEPTDLLATFDRIAALGLACEISALDLDLGDDTLEADLLRDVLICALSHPALRGVTLWGWREDAMWHPGAALIRRDGTETPAGTVWRELVLGRWWTDARAITDASGEVTLPVFHGDHSVSAETNDLRLNAEIRVGKPIAIEIRP
jgi:endo-1,4-beta-xylanase